jgi:hypothetical protein
MPPEDIAAQTAAAVAAATATPHPAAVQAAPVVPIVATAPVVAATPAPTSTAITLTSEQWASYTASLTRLDQLEAANVARDREAAQAAIDTATAKGEIKKAFDLTREQNRLDLEAERSKLKVVEDRSKRYALDGELGRALAAYNLVPHGAEQITQLIRDDFTAEGRGDSIVVQSKDFRSVADYVAAQMATRFTHMQRAGNPAGGTAGGSGTQSLPTPGANAAAQGAPGNMSDAIRAHHAAQAAVMGNGAESGGGVIGEDGKVIPRAAAGFGLRPLVPAAQRRQA